jgi:hypothetical protein
VVIRRTGWDRGGNGRAMADRVLWELAGQRGRLLTNLARRRACCAAVAIFRCACISCAWPAS